MFLVLKRGSTLKLSEEEKAELRTSARSAKLRDDLMRLAQNHFNPVLVNGQVDMDRLLTFLDECNAFFGHRQKPFLPMIDKDMRL
jgi:hypothetical protein